MAEQLNEQLRHLEQRFKSAGVNRRGFMKIAAGAAAGTATIDGVARYVGPGAVAQDEVEAGPDETFYNFALRNDPVSFDWNLNLYCNADVETFSGLLMFDADLNAIPDWAETFESNDDASVWTFNLRPDNQGWSNRTEQRPVTAGDFVYSFRRQLDPETAPPTPASSSTSRMPSGSTPAPRTTTAPIPTPTVRRSAPKISASSRSTTGRSK